MSISDRLMCPWWLCSDWLLVVPLVAGQCILVYGAGSQSAVLPQRFSGLDTGLRVVFFKTGKLSFTARSLFS